jgi:hypothetical protein
MLRLETLARRIMKELILAFIGTFFGAWAAFQFQLYEQARSEKKGESAAGRRALLVLCNQYGQTKRYYHQALDEHKSDEFRWLKLQAFDAFHSFLRLDVNSLGFLLDSNQPQLIQEVLLAEEAFLELVTTVHQRNDVHLNQLQVALQKLGLDYLPSTEEKIKEILGQRLMTVLKDLTDSMYDLTDAVLSHNEVIFKRLNDYLNKNYSGYTPLKREDVIRNCQPNGDSRSA